ncbi:MAG TPA: HAD family hydrolase [Rhodanobacteraceae bacterium]|nr:HAD family hydrolase [Rhodanobacteraceae bacterium]
MRILAISLDLDDTLWPVEPAIRNAEQRLDEWLRAEHPAVAAAWPIEAMRELRETLSRERPDLAHDFTAQRLLTLERAFASCGLGAHHVDAAFEIYYAARNTVDCYPDTRTALAALAARLPLVSISNGNADLARIGLDHHFRATITAREVGCAKPDRRIFDAACARLGIAAEHVLHVGDDPALDVAGARAAGFRTAWLNRGGVAWSHGAPPDLALRDLDELAAWITTRAA